MGRGGDSAISTHSSSPEEDIWSLLGFTEMGIQSHFDSNQVTEGGVPI